jgi:hypothetical protein
MFIENGEKKTKNYEKYKEKYYIFFIDADYQKLKEKPK